LFTLLNSFASVWLDLTGRIFLAILVLWKIKSKIQTFYNLPSGGGFKKASAGKHFLLKMQRDSKFSSTTKEKLQNYF